MLAWTATAPGAVEPHVPAGAVAGRVTVAGLRGDGGERVDDAAGALDDDRAPERAGGLAATSASIVTSPPPCMDTSFA
jgi:hypothetical protein